MSGVADLIASRLRDVGVRTIFGMPGGGGNLDLIEAAGNAALPFVLTATETAGALAAMAQAEVTGRPGACLATLGPGAASIVNGVACAFLDRAPLVVFTDAHSTAARGAFEHQHFDQHAIFERITKWSGSLSPESAYETIEQAFMAVLELPPGPVHLDCPGDFTSAREPSAGPIDRREEPPRTVPEPGRFERLLRTRRKPLLLIGLGARGSEDAHAIRRLCERRRVPAMVTYKAKGVVSDADAAFAGVFTNGAIEQSMVAESDLLIGVGLDPVELLPRPWPYAQPIVYVGRWRVADAHVPFAVQHVTDVPSGIRDIEAMLPESEWNLDRVRALVDGQRRLIDIPADGLTAARVVTIVAERLAAASRVTVDAGAHMFPATMLWPVDEPNQMLISNGLSTMGFALPAAIGAALVDRTRPVVALTGDGGLLMCIGELLTAVREQLKIVVIVFSDASLSLIEIKQQQRRLRPAGVALGSVAWPALANSFGMPAFVAGNEADLARAVEQAMACTGPALVEAKIDRSTYGATVAAVRG